MFICFNPPWKTAVSTNVAARFLKLIDKHFDKQSPFHKNFNRQTVKVSYSCMPNMASIISSHNRRVTGAVEEHVECGCNCRNGQASCVLQGRCLTPNVVYKCAVSTQQEYKEYIGLTSNTFKQRYYAHSNSFNRESNAHSTALSTHIWELKNKNIPFTTEWSIQRLAAPYSKETQKCQLCLTEKTLISLADSSASLNQRNKIVEKNSALGQVSAKTLAVFFFIILSTPPHYPALIPGCTIIPALIFIFTMTVYVQPP